MGWPRSLLLLGGLGLSLVAVAQDEAPAPDAPEAASEIERSDEDKACWEQAPADASLRDKADAIFGACVVGKLATVLLWDVIFWDNTLPGDAALGFESDGWTITSVDKKGYHSQEGWTSSAPGSLVKKVLEPYETRLGELEVRISYSQHPEPSLIARVSEAPVDLEALGLAAKRDALPEGIEEAREIVNTLGPIPIVVDLVSATRMQAAVRIDPALVPIEVGDEAYDPKRKQFGMVTEIGEEGVELRGAEVKTATEAPGNPNNAKLPIVVLWLVLGALFFTFRMQFINFRAFWHAIRVTRGDYDNPDDPGEISHFQALSSALSATVGLGNIAGVAIAISLGGPGAIIWMIIAGVLGMSSKFVECTLGQMYRVVRADGSVSGGPMHYLDEGLAEMGMRPIGKLAAVLFALMCIGGSLGGGNMFQSNQSYAQLAEVIDWFKPAAEGEVVFTATDNMVIETGTEISVPEGPTFLVQSETDISLAAGKASAPIAVIAKIAGVEGNVKAGSISITNVDGLSVSNATATAGGAHRGIVYGFILAAMVALVIIGGIRRIGAAAGIIVPAMCGVYVLAGLYILLVNASAVPGAMAEILSLAFNPTAPVGGFIGVLAIGFQRASFSNEAGIGSASIAHSAAATDEPVREGIVALLEPFIDTVCVCTMTGLVVVVTGAYKLENVDGVVMTSRAFESAFGMVAPWILTFAVVMFAFSTMISWSYYGERCSTKLLGEWARLPYRIVFILCVIAGASLNLGSVLDFSDLMILGMAFPNIFGAVLLSGKVKTALDDYLERLHAGQFKVHS